jgi:hypothetical protein
MLKIKTHRGAAKRFKKTERQASNGIMRSTHILTKKSRLQSGAGRDVGFEGEREDRVADALTWSPGCHLWE